MAMTNWKEAANGGAGNDWLVLGQIMHGNAGDDLIQGGVSTTQIYGDDDNDTIWAPSNSLNVTIHGGDGNDFIETESSGHTIFGDAGNDVITVKTFIGGNNVSVDGGDGDDVIHLGENDTTVTVDEGDDVIYKLAGHQVDILFATGATYSHAERVGTSNDLVIYFDGGASVRLSDYYAQQSEWVLPALSSSTTFIGGGSSEAAYGVFSVRDVMCGNGGDANSMRGMETIPFMGVTVMTSSMATRVMTLPRAMTETMKSIPRLGTT
ncbi:hypothetical protein RAD04_05305 [Bradyrhizobium sp. 25ACV]